MKNLKLKLLTITVVAATVSILPFSRVSAAWKNDNGNWYCYNEQGEMKTGWFNDNGIWYYLQPSGEMKTGWFNDKGTWYYLQPSGEMKTGWINDKGTWYFTESSGKMQTGVIKIEDKIYSFDVVTGAMQKGSVTINGQNYRFEETGELTGNDVLAFTKQFNSNGVEITTNNLQNNKNEQDAETTNKDSNLSEKHNNSNSSNNSGNSGNNSSNSEGNNKPSEGVSTDYLENYRDQYHYSPAKGWANDPNGMVYFNGEYHLFYQYYPDDSIWGPMHWGHAVSKDLIHWEELPIALYPDEGGTIFSGSAVVDKDNTSGFFDGIEGGGLVAIYTQDYKDDNGNEKQKQSIAYSKDSGRTWEKYDGNPVISSEDDPLNNSAFRDPKVLYNEEAGKWFMVVAGGPLRFFSSDNLKNWKPEAMQKDIVTECPDFYKLKVEGSGKEKWVLSEGGRYYRVGDFKEKDGVWTFVPDEEDHIVMNFAKDSYAAQTYYGTHENGTPDGRRIMINWMNNWDYCNDVASITRTFNGTFALQTEVKLVQTDHGIRLIQKPIDEYESLRKSHTTFDNVTISPDQPNVMSNISGNKYEIVAEFTPDENTTEVGFKLRVGKSSGQETVVKYDIASGKLTLDRSKSGKSPTADKFLESYSQKMSKTADGKIQLHIFVDAATIEVYGNNGEVAGAAQIFPNRSSNGIEVYSVGGTSIATINFYPLSSIWNNESDSKDSVLVSLSEGDLAKKVGDEFTVYTVTVPDSADQGVTWEYDSNILDIVSQDNEKTTFKTKAIGNTKLTATSKDKKSNKTIDVNVYESNPSNIIKDLNNFETTGDWYVKDNAYTGSCSGDGFAMAEETNERGKVSILEADADVSDGNAAGLVLLSQNSDPKQGSIIANINKNGEYRVFAFVTDDEGNSSVEDLNSGIVPKTDDSKYNLRSEVSEGHIKYFINDELVCDTKQDYYEIGRFGFNIYGGTTAFKNITFNNNEPSTETSIPDSDLTFDSTPIDLHVSDDSYVVDGGKNNNGFAISDQDIDVDENTYVFETDAKMLGDWHNTRTANGDVAGVVLFTQGDDYFRDGGIIANVGKWGHYRLFAQVQDGEGGMKEINFAEGDVPEAQYNKYHIKIELVGNNIIYWINGEKVCYVTQDYYTTGKFGFNVWNGASEFRNITLTSNPTALEEKKLTETSGINNDMTQLSTEEDEKTSIDNISKETSEEKLDADDQVEQCDENMDSQGENESDIDNEGNNDEEYAATDEEKSQDNEEIKTDESSEIN